MKPGDKVFISRYGSAYYKCAGKLLAIVDKIVNTYPEKIYIVHFEPREILKAGLSLKDNPAEFFKNEVAPISEFLTYANRQGVGEKVVVTNKDRTRTIGQAGIVVDTKDDMTSVRFPDGSEQWFMSSELEPDVETRVW